MSGFTDTTHPLVGRKVRIRTDAIVGQDFGWRSWKDAGEVFEVTSLVAGQTNVFCAAPGYGQKGDYGNGELCVKITDLLTEEGHPLNGAQFPELKVVVEGLGETVYIVTEAHSKDDKGKRGYVGEVGRGEGCYAKTKQEALDLAEELVEAWRFWRTPEKKA